MSEQLRYEAARMRQLLAVLERMAAGERDLALPLSPLNDELDAIAYAVNVLSGELQFRHDEWRVAEAEKAAALRRARDEAERANESKSVFLRNVSHEIRSPITTILFCTDLLSQAGAGAASERLLAQLRSNCQSLLALVDDVLDLSRVEAGRLDVQLARVCLDEVIDEVMRNFEGQAGAKRITLTAATAQTPTVITTDRQRVRQILTNLIGNAIKFTPAGEVRVGIDRAAPAQVAIDVWDTGIGISREQQALLFHPFAQADRVSMEFGGTGLGLALSQRLAAALGGELLLVDSEPGAGSRFRLSLPAAATATAAGTTARASGSRSAVRPLAGLRVLLAEDTPEIRESLTMLLEGAGATVDAVANGSHAVEQSARHDYDVILMDVRMPVMDGVAATREIRRARCQTPILALTAGSMRQDIAPILEAGFSGHIPKPLTFDEAVERIVAVTGASSSRS